MALLVEALKTDIECYIFDGTEVIKNFYFDLILG